MAGDKKRGRPRQVSDDTAALALAMYRARPHGMTRDAYFADVAERCVTYGLRFRWASFDAIHRAITRAEKREKTDDGFAERVELYAQLLPLVDSKFTAARFRSSSECR